MGTVYWSNVENDCSVTKIYVFFFRKSASIFRIIFTSSAVNVIHFFCDNTDRYYWCLHCKRFMQFWSVSRLRLEGFTSTLYFFLEK